MKRYGVTVFFLILAIFFSFLAFFKLKINADYLVFLPGYKPGVTLEQIENQDLKDLLNISEKFSDGTQVVVILQSDKTFFQPQEVKKIIDLQNDLSKLEGIKMVLSVVNYVFRTPYFNGNTISEKITEDPESMSFISKDGKYLLLNCILSPSHDPKIVLKGIDNVLKNYATLSPLVFGQIVINDHLFNEIIRQILVYPLLMFLTILIVFWVQTRSLKASLFSLVIPLIATIIVYGFSTLFKVQLNVMTVMCVSFLLVIGSAYGLHFYNGIVRFGKDVRKKMFRPIFFSMFTTAIGFLSFLFVKITAFKQLGVMVSSGLALIFLILFTAGYELFYDEKKEYVNTFSFKMNNALVGKILIYSVIVACVISPFVIPKIKIGMDQASYFTKNSQIGRALKILTEEFSYREPVYIMMEKNSFFTIKDSENIKQILERIGSVTGVASVQFPSSYPVPTLVILSRMQPAISYFVIDGKTIRIVANITDEAYRQAGKVKRALYEQLKDYTEYKFTIASTSFIVDQINSQILRSQLQSLITSLILIFVSIIIAFRNISFSVVIVVPVLLTALFNFVFIYLMKLKLDIATSIVASILVGLVVDYSIHLAHDLKATRTVSKTIENIGMPVLTNALGLIAGFLVMSLSKLALFRNVSLLLSFGIAFGVSFTIFSQPLIIEKMVKKFEVRSISFEGKDGHEK
ncbi:MAG: efflux RND transporter permease subunit [Pseudothermotoga sp.]